MSEWKIDRKRKMLAAASVAPLPLSLSLGPGVKVGVHPLNTDGITQAIL